MAESIGRANIEVGADLSPLDAGLEEAKQKVKAAVDKPAEAAKPPTQAASAATTKAADAADQHAESVKETVEATKELATETEKVAESTEKAFNVTTVTQFASAVASIVASITAVAHGMQGLINASNELALLQGKISDSFKASTTVAMDEMSKQLNTMRDMYDERKRMLEKDYALQLFVADKIQKNYVDMLNNLFGKNLQLVPPEFEVQLKQLTTAFETGIRGAVRGGVREGRKEIEAFKVELRNLRNEMNKSATLGGAISQGQVAELVKVIAERVEASR